MSAPEDGRVVVCIPTYRRPVQLARLLRALRAQRDVDAFEIVVGNNDDHALDASTEMHDTTLPPFREIVVATRGVSAVRNTMIDAVLCDPSVRWIACLDDDQIPADDWLSALLAAGTRYDADLVGGPVVRTVSQPTFWSDCAADTSYLPTAPGPTAMLNEAGNLLLATRFLRKLGRPPFSLDFGLSGGEDYEFFLYARSRDARIVWQPTARVHEPLPEERLTLRGVVGRFYAIAAYQARADRRYRGTPHVLRTIAIDFARIPVATARSLLRDRPIGRAIGVVTQYAAIAAGRVAGLAGARHERYGQDVTVPRP